MQHYGGKAVEIMQFGVTITNPEGKILYTNPAEAKMHGYTVDELIGKDLGVLAPPELRKPLTIEQIKEVKRRNLRESVNARKDGSTFPVRLRSDVVKDASGEPIAIVTTCEDITESKQTAEKLYQHTRELTLFNQLSDLLQTCDTENKTYTIVIDICKEFFPSDSGCLYIMDPVKATMNIIGFWGGPPESLQSPIPEGSKSFRNPIPQNRSYADVTLLCPHQIYSPEHECLSVPITTSGETLGLLSLCFNKYQSEDPDDGLHQKLESKRLVLSRIARHYALSLVNLRLREKLHMEAIRDPLTDLYNRRYMEESLKREAHRAKRHNTPVGIIMLDVDHFKRFNDRHGHKAGDSVLKELATFLMNHIRGEDIACRYGGEEFLLILPEATLKVARQRAEELRRGIKQIDLRHEGQSFHITISLGVAALPDHGPDIMDTVTSSDAALYQAKANGRDQVVVASS